MGSMGHFLHHLEVRPHGVREAGHLAQTWDEHDLRTCALVHVDQNWLVEVGDLRAILLLIVLVIGDFLTFFFLGRLFRSLFSLLRLFGFDSLIKSVLR